MAVGQPLFFVRISSRIGCAPRVAPERREIGEKLRFAIQSERGCVLGAPAAARWTVMSRCMRFKGTWEYEHGVPSSGGGARANTMILKMFNALETADDSPAE